VSVLQAAPPGYGDPGGLPALRAALASWVARSRGVRATAEQVVVTAGAQGAFDLLARTLLGPGTTIAVENPGYPPARRAFRAAGTDVVGVPVDDDGIVVRRIPARAKAVCVTPSPHAPTGAVLSMARRRELLARDLLVIEDDYDTEHRYVDRPLEPLQRLDVTDRVVYVGSFSKTLTPSLRIGFVVAPARLAERLVTTRAAIDTQPAHLTQAALAEFLTSGGFERHLRRSRRAYRLRRDHLLTRLDDLVAAGVLAGRDPCHAGLHVTVRFPDRTDIAGVVSGLRERGINVNATNDAWIGRGAPLLELGFGLADDDAVDRGIEALVQVHRRPRGT